MTLSTTARTLASPRRWVEPAARAGYATKGILYMLIGALAVMAATGNGGNVGGADAATRTVGEQPFGQVLLALIAIGMFGLAAFRFVEAVLDPEGFSDRGRAKGAVKRIGCAIGGVLSGALGVLAVQLAFGDAPSGGGDREWLSRVLSWEPAGPILVGIAGAVTIGFAIYQLARAWKTNFAKHLRTSEMSHTTRRVAVTIGRVGLVAHGVVLGIIGAGLIRAASASRARGAYDMGSALREIGESSHGQALLVIVALGVFAFGLYGIVEARYRDLPAG